MKDHIPRDIYIIDKTLHEAGFCLYIVGGAVRNMILGKPPIDWDLATDARPDDIISLFRYVIPTGIRHGTVTIRFRKNTYEITTFRIDGTYGNSRHPDSVEYGVSIFDDLRRRDFTINAMAWGPRSERLLDPHEGRCDVHRKIVRTVGNPVERFHEDGLRIIRGLRFAAVLNFTIHKDTLEAMHICRKNLERVSIERIRNEFNKILCSSCPSRNLLIAADKGILPFIIPQLERTRKIMRHDSGKSLFAHLLASCDCSPQNLELRLAALLHKIAPAGEHRRAGNAAGGTGNAAGGTGSAAGGTGSAAGGHESAELARDICRRLRYSRAQIQRVYRLIQAPSPRPDMSAADIRRFISAVGRDLADDRIRLEGAYLTTFPDWLNNVKAQVQRMLANETALSISDLAVNGNDLHTLAGIPRSSAMKTILTQLLAVTLEHPNINTKPLLLEQARNLYGKYCQQRNTSNIIEQ